MAKMFAVTRDIVAVPRIQLGDRPPSYLSKTRLATELDISETTVDDYVRRGLLPKPVRLGGSVRWSWIQVQALLEAHAPNAQSGDAFMDRVNNVAQNS
ncbi:AlpA family transcriptional regulator [Brucella sp. 2280]|uniref:helix-turn-helix transcriptional regulator n=1 Tax=Brucella sp. 2280 TaxID=2592625 RepID=UPI0018860BD5|nr:transcriptional regulator [Brucella sp. 2280]